MATAIRGGIIAAKLNLIPVRRGYWGNKLGLPHTIAMKARLGAVLSIGLTLARASEASERKY